MLSLVSSRWPTDTSRGLGGRRLGVPHLPEDHHAAGHPGERPVFVTETSRAGTVEERLAWLRDSVALMHKLRADGMPIVGYTWWPLFALVDWLYRETTDPVDRWLVQMGLFDLERDGAGVLQRTPTALVKEFHRLAQGKIR